MYEYQLISTLSIMHSISNPLLV